jgi:hypothetical protein
MTTQMSSVSVGSPEQLEVTITQYIAQGYTMASRTPTSATLVKKKEFNVVWAIIGFFLCLLPLLIYCIVYATQKDLMVEIKVQSGVPAIGMAGAVQMSEDGRYWWNGSQWEDADRAVPPAAQRSPDGRYWWDGTRWRRTPETGGAVASPSVIPLPPPATPSAGTSPPQPPAPPQDSPPSEQEGQA